jgi:hypothetical protein
MKQRKTFEISQVLICCGLAHKDEEKQLGLRTHFDIFLHAIAWLTEVPMSEIPKFNFIKMLRYICQ